MHWRSTKQRLLDQLDLQTRQAAEDRRAFREILLEQQVLQERFHQSNVDLIKAIAESVQHQAESFNKYLDLVQSKGEPTVRVMNDASEAYFEREYKKAHPEIEDLPTELIDMPIVDQLAHQDALSVDLREFIKGI